MQRSVGRDLRRYRQRQSAEASFWRSLGVLGSVGWPIAVMMVAGAWLGKWLDQKWETGAGLTLLFVFVGAILGGSIAWTVIQGTNK